jgi:hypothetical protein
MGAFMSDQEDPIRTTVKQVHQWTTLDEQQPTKLSSRRGTYWKIVLATWVATHVLLYWSLDLGPAVTTADAASHVSFGLPFPFLYQDDPWFYGNRLYHRGAYFVSPYENPTHMIWPRYFLDLALVWGSLLLITLLILWVIRKVRLLKAYILLKTPHDTAH